jgi:hypothetical protein
MQEHTIPLRVQGLNKLADGTEYSLRFMFFKCNITVIIFYAYFKSQLNNTLTNALQLHYGNPTKIMYELLFYFEFVNTLFFIINNGKICSYLLHDISTIVIPEAYKMCIFAKVLYKIQGFS